MDSRTQAHSVDLEVAWQPETRNSLLWIASMQTFNIILT